MASVLGMRTTTNLTDSTERAKAWRLGIMDEFPDAAPLAHLIYRVGKEKVSDPEYNWFERRYSTRQLTAVTTTHTMGIQAVGFADTLEVGSGEAYNCVKGCVLYNGAVDEYVLVTADPTVSDHLSVTRGIGATGNTVAWTNGQTVQVIGNAHAEGEDVGSAISSDPSKKYNYCQIFRNVASVTRTLASTMLRTGDRKKDTQKQALLQHEIDKEWTFLMGIASEDLTPTTGPRRTSAGLKSVITTNVTDFAAGLTLDGWNTALKTPMTSGADEKLLLCGADMLLALENMARSNTFQWEQVGKQDSFGMTMRKWITSFGTVYIKEHKLLSRSTEYKDWGFLIDPDEFVYRFVKDTEWLPNRQGNGVDGYIGEYLAEVGLEIHNEYNHAIFKNCSTYVA